MLDSILKAAELLAINDVQLKRAQSFRSKWWGFISAFSPNRSSFAKHNTVIIDGSHSF